MCFLKVRVPAAAAAAAAAAVGVVGVSGAQLPFQKQQKPTHCDHFEL